MDVALRQKLADEMTHQQPVQSQRPWSIPGLLGQVQDRLGLLAQEFAPQAVAQSLSQWPNPYTTKWGGGQGTDPMQIAMDWGMNPMGLLMAKMKGLLPDVAESSAKGGLLSTADDWRGLHRPPMRDSGAPLHDLTGGGTVYPDDVYSFEAARFYGHGEDAAADAALFAKIHRLRNKPEEIVGAYRAVPLDVYKSLRKQGVATPQAGDWVTISKQYAIDHGERQFGKGNYKVLSIHTKAKNLFTNGDSPYEFGYDPVRD